MTIEHMTKELRKIERFSPFFLTKKLDEIITELETMQYQTCGHCRYLTTEKDDVYYCRLYKSAKPWGGFCEKWTKR